MISARNRLRTETQTEEPDGRVRGGPRGARHLRIMLLMTATAASNIPPAKMVALGAGVAGLQPSPQREDWARSCSATDSRCDRWPRPDVPDGGARRAVSRRGTAEVQLLRCSKTGPSRSPATSSTIRADASRRRVGSPHRHSSLVGTATADVRGRARASRASSKFLKASFF